jgi:putative transposase
MPSHVHWIAIPLCRESLAQTFRGAHSRYAVYGNQKHERASSHLWQNRYHILFAWEKHIWRALGYMEMNPVRAGLASRAEEFEWSSAACHTGRRQPPKRMETGFWSSQFSPVQWNLILSEDGEDWAELRRATRLGRPWADSEFVGEVEQSTGTRLTARPPGRPRMSKY